MAQEPPGSNPVVAATRQHAFIIPFKVEPPRDPREAPVEVQLHVSGDQGATWQIADRVKPDKTSFTYRAPHDGEYWYAIRTMDAQQVVRPEGPLQPQLKVVVDTVAPRLELTATRGLAGEIVARWQAVDPHLKPSSLKIEYQPTPNGPWESVAVDTPPGAMRHTSSGEATWWPRSTNGSLAVRAEITDSSGNPAMSQAIVKPSDHPSDATAGASSDRPTTPDAAAWPSDRAASDPFNGRSADNRPPATEQAPLEVGRRDPAPPEQPRSAAAPRLASRPATTARPRDPQSPSPLDFSILGVGERARMLNSRTFDLEYDVDSVGSSGISKVELWGTVDGGRTWSVYGVDADQRSPVPVRVEKEGIYGFRVVVYSGTGLAAQPPAAGDLADVWIGVDQAVPAARITAAEVNNDGSELVVTWEATDDALDPKPISLSFSERPDGPWTPIASGLENSGSYSWRVEGRVPPIVYLRLEARDEAGNIATYDQPEPVSLDRARPQGHIRDVRVK